MNFCSAQNLIAARPQAAAVSLVVVSAITIVALLEVVIVRKAKTETKEG